MLRWLFIFLTLFTGRTSAQSFLTVLDSTGFKFPASVTLGSNVSFDVLVQNTGNTTIYDTLWIVVGVDTGQVVPLSSHFGQYDSLMPAEIKQYSITNFFVDPVYFQDGNNTVVIWPITYGGSDHDSTEFNTFILGIDELELQHLKVYPNPCSDIVTIDAGDRLPDYILITDVHGRWISEERKTKTVDLSLLSPGIYFLEISIDHKKGKIKILRQ